MPGSANFHKGETVAAALPGLGGTSNFDSSEKEIRLPSSQCASSRERGQRVGGYGLIQNEGSENNSKARNTAALEEKRSWRSADVALYVNYN